MSDNQQQTLQPILDGLGKALPAAVQAVEDSYGDTVIVIDRKQSHDVFKHLKNAGFNLLLDIAGVDRSGIEHTDRFQLTYVMYAIDSDLRLRVKVNVPEDAMTVPSVSDLWESANWAEREAFDMFGFRFEGHPNLVRILNHREFVGHPLRKDYPIMKGQWATTSSDLMPDLEKE